MTLAEAVHSKYKPMFVRYLESYAIDTCKRSGIGELEEDMLESFCELEGALNFTSTSDFINVQHTLDTYIKGVAWALHR